MEKRKIILDCDPGHDDAIAIMMAAKHPAIDFFYFIHGTFFLSSMTAHIQRFTAANHPCIV